ncbi:MinD/ParA family ATP-binding protein [Uliginosibacterium gangwonense]|uniref:MinD/ParA family ATP-binding protein n=1 Tax=Uliginosibacterium gangwonense TaxID=392736 RepID=UPI0003A094B4|nr:hypothetical protein [Uliginosibacterium gangwonense]
MLGEQYDQAAGLRRLFHTTPPRVVGLVPCCAAVMPWVARQIVERASMGEAILALDEWGAYGNLADALHASPRFDLLQAAQGQLMPSDCLVDVGPNLQLAAISRLTTMLGSDRMLNQRILGLFKDLQRHYREWFVVTRPADALGVSPLLLASPALILVTDTRPESVTAAYATLKQLAHYGQPEVATVVFAQGDSREAQHMAANLHRVVRDQLRVSLRFAGDLAQALSQSGGAESSEFMNRLSLAAANPAQRPANWRPKHVHL